MVTDILIAVVLIGLPLAAFHLGKYYGLYLVYKASRDGKIAVLKLPSKSEIEGLLKKALGTSKLGTLEDAFGPKPDPKKDLPN